MTQGVHQPPYTSYNKQSVVPMDIKCCLGENMLQVGQQERYESSHNYRLLSSDISQIADTYPFGEKASLEHSAREKSELYI